MQLLGPAEVLAPDGEIDVLLVEDGDAEAERARGALQSGLGAVRLTRCGTLEEARTALAASRYDVALLALALADTTGLRAVSALRTGWPDLPLVVLADDPTVCRRVLAAGAHDVLVRGALDGPSLAAAVRHAVDRARFAVATARYERIARSLLDAIESPTCAVDGDGVVVAVNAAWQRWALENAADLSRCGEGADYVAVCRAAAADGDLGAAAVADGLLDVLGGRRARFERDDTHARLGRWFRVRITPMHGLPGAVVSHVDITVAKTAEDRARQLALHDGLTGLPNRLLLRDRLEQALSEASRHGTVVAVALVDLDHFHRVNDGLGRAAGDAVLTAVAERLGRRLRNGDTLARLAGDQFVVVWRDVAGEVEAEALAGRLEDGLREPLDVDGTVLTVTASLGVAVGRPPQTGEQLLQAADAAMHDAKARGRARRRLHSPDLEREAVERTETSADLQHALERGELVLHYQPVVDLTTGTVTGVEALVRWQHPHRGLLGPASFLPLAEATGLVVPLGREVLRQACSEAARWPDGPGIGLDVAINLSAQQMSQPDVVRSVREALEESGLSP
ncbi:MAG TPA: diguanylate cyclase, partial [Mycobacteriales bacterium]|nr:diguanylate cyclase [Mycobacteriales bacterium]